MNMMMMIHRQLRDKVSNVSSFASKTVREALQLGEEEAPSWTQFVRSDDDDDDHDNDDDHDDNLKGIDSNHFL